jgi:hypothetical protein
MDCNKRTTGGLPVTARVLPSARRLRRESMHVDPEFTTFTYGDPIPPKRGLKDLPSDGYAVRTALDGCRKPIDLGKLD